MGSRKACLNISIFETTIDPLGVVSFTHISALSDDFHLSFVHGADTGYGGLVKLCLRNWCSGGHGGKAVMLK